MAVFTTADKLEEKKGSGLEDISSDSEEAVRFYAEERIRQMHQHADGKPVNLKVVKEQESLLEQAAHDSHSAKHAANAASQNAGNGAYSAASKGVSFSIACDCGQTFHAGGSDKQNEVNVYKINQQGDNVGGYAKANMEKDTAYGSASKVFQAYKR